jgi:hypothetical protein
MKERVGFLLWQQVCFIDYKYYRQRSPKQIFCFKNKKYFHHCIVTCFCKPYDKPIRWKHAVALWKSFCFLLQSSCFWLCCLLCRNNCFPYISLKYEWIFLAWLKDAVPVLRSVPRKRLLYPGTEQLGSGTVPGRSAKLRFTTGLRHIRGFRLEDFRLSSFWTELSFSLPRWTLFVFVCNIEVKPGWMFEDWGTEKAGLGGGRVGRKT